MINIKKHLFLALSIVFCASFQIFAMKKEKSSASGERIDSIGDSSSESGTSDPLEEAQREKNNKQWLTKQINILKTMDQDLQEKREYCAAIKDFQKQIQTIISNIKDMLSGRTPMNMKNISERMKIAHFEYRFYIQ
jgi:hypothetical protein